MAVIGVAVYLHTHTVHIHIVHTHIIHTHISHTHTVHTHICEDKQINILNYIPYRTSYNTFLTFI